LESALAGWGIDFGLESQLQLAQVCWPTAVPRLENPLVLSETVGVMKRFDHSSAT
jgi:hypothetical protein